MKFSISVLVLGVSHAHGTLLERQGCNSNNCARAVTGTRDKEPDVTSRRALCSSFMLTSVTPDPTTSTITAPAVTITPTTVVVTNTLQVTTTLLGPRDVAPRAVTVVPSVVPPYATACSGAAAFSSACSCWGITATQSTAPVPTVYVTVTPTSTETATRTETLTLPTETVDLTCAAVRVPGPGENGVNIGNFRSCANNGAFPFCGCGATVEGGFACFSIPVNGQCTIRPQCSASSDCAATEACLKAGNTNCAINTCTPVKLGGCPGGPVVVPKLRMMKRETAKDTSEAVEFPGAPH